MPKNERKTRRVTVKIEPSLIERAGALDPRPMRLSATLREAIRAGLPTLEKTKGRRANAGPS